MTDSLKSPYDVEITPEMIEAGLSVYRATLPLEASVEMHDPDKVRQIYEAMALARDGLLTESDLKRLQHG